jgi:hypothetical protein
MHGRI